MPEVSVGGGADPDTAAKTGVSFGDNLPTKSLSGGGVTITLAKAAKSVALPWSSEATRPVDDEGEGSTKGVGAMMRFVGAAGEAAAGVAGVPLPCACADAAAVALLPLVAEGASGVDARRCPALMV